MTPLAVKHYLTLIRFVVTDSLWRFRKLSITVLISAQLGLFLEIGALSIAVGYAYLLERGDSIELLGNTYFARSSPELLILVAMGICIMLVLSTLFKYFGGIGAIKVRRRYQDFCSERVIDILRNPDFVWINHVGEVGGSGQSIQLVRADSAYAGRVAQQLLDSAIPCVILVISFAVIIYLEPFASLMIMALAGIATLVLYQINRQAAEHTRVMEDQAPSSGRYVRNLIRMIQNDASYQIEESVTQAPEVKAFLDARDGRIASLDHARTVNSALLALVLLVIIAYLGSGIIEDAGGWGRLLVFLFALRYLLSSFRTTTTLLTSINRFYPNLIRYRDFLRSAKKVPEPGDESIRRIRVASQPIEKSQKELAFNSDCPIVILTPIEVSRFTITTLLSTILKQNATISGNCHYVARIPFAARGHLLREIIDPTGVANIEKLIRELLPNSKLFNRIRLDLINHLDELVTEIYWDRMTRNEQFAISLLRSMATEANFLIVDGMDFSKLSAADQQSILGAWQGKQVIFAVSNLAVALAFSKTSFVVTDKRSVRGIGNHAWLAEHADKLDWFAQASAVGSSLVTDAEEELDLF